MANEMEELISFLSTPSPQNAARNSLLQIASDEKKKADENMMKLVDDQKRETTGCKTRCKDRNRKFDETVECCEAHRR